MTKLEIPTYSYIDDVETRMKAQLAGNPSTLISNLEAQIQNSCNQFRLKLTFLLGNMFSVEHDTVANLAASIEMLDSAKSVHDNLTGKSLHKIANAAFLTSATVLAGDLAFAAAARLATAPQSTAVMKIFSETLQLMVSGEITHMFQNGSGFTSEAYFHRIHATTASLFELAGQATAILGSTGDEIIKAAQQFGYEIGMAYQIVEDALDFINFPEPPDKSKGQNLRQGIVTLPTIYYLEKHPHGPDIQSIINGNGHGPDVIESVIKAISNSNAIEQTIEEAKAFVQRGLQILNNFPVTPERAQLELLCKQIIPERFDQISKVPK
jgi:geranylgeranyl pyrophosphate synthase